MDFEFIIVLSVLILPPFLIVIWMYGLFNIRGAVITCIILCALVVALFFVYENGISSAINPQAGGGMKFVQMIVLPPIAGGAIMGLVFCFWRRKRALIIKRQEMRNKHYYSSEHTIK